MFSHANIHTLIIPENFSGELTSDGFYEAKILEVYNLSNYDITGVFSDTTIIHTSLDEESSIIYEGPYAMVLQDGEKLLVEVPRDIENGELIIPHGVTSIVDHLCASRTDITYVEFPESLKSIGESAFDGCSELTDIVLPNSLTYIGSYSFQGCLKLQSVHYNGDISSWCNITYASQGWYDSSPCQNFTEQGKLYMNGELITEINIPDDVTTIPVAAFCKVHVRTINLNKTSIINTYAFYGNTALEQIVLPTTLTNINSSAFSGCSKLVEVYNLSSLALELGSITNGHVTYYAKIIHTSMESDSAIFTMDGYKFITDANGIVWLYNCNIENPVELILPTLPNAKTYKLNANALYNQGPTVKTLVIPTEVVAFAVQGFNKWVSLSKVEYLGTLKQWCNISFSSDVSPLYGFSYSQFKDQAEFWCNNEHIVDLVIPSDITTVPQYAFVYAPITTVNLNAAKKVGQYAFAYCNKLKSIDFGTGTQVQIGGFAFGWSGLESLVIPNNVSYLDSNAFYQNKLLKTVRMEGTSKIDFGSYVFQNCAALESVVFREGATKVGSNMFISCGALTNVVLVEGMSSIGDYAFWVCPALNSLIIPSTIKSIAGYALGNSNKLVITMLSTVPCTLASASVIAYVKEIIVPKGSLAAYQAATNWSTYASKIKEAAE